MNNLEQVVQRAKTDIAKGYVFVHMPIPQLETLLAGLEEAQKKLEELETRINLTDKALLSALGLISDLENELIGIKNVAVCEIEKGDPDRMKKALTAIKWAVEMVIYDKEPADEDQ